MPLPSFLQRKAKKTPERRAAPAGPADDSGPVQEARTRARRRLIGAVVLLAIGVIVFPLVFETQPRPMAVDTPIEVAGRATTVAPPPAPHPSPALARAPLPVTIEPPPEIITERAEPPASAPALVPKPEPKPEPKSLPRPEPAPPPVPAASPKADDGNRARALLDDSAAASAPRSARFVVQAGAYNDANALREARAKLEKLGLKTYTQVIDNEAGKRTRVRIGPFASRDDAEHAAAKIKAAGLPAAILTL
jgi:DedD protein